VGSWDRPFTGTKPERRERVLVCMLLSLGWVTRLAVMKMTEAGDFMTSYPTPGRGRAFRRRRRTHSSPEDTQGCSTGRQALSDSIKQTDRRRNPEKTSPQCQLYVHADSDPLHCFFCNGLIIYGYDYAPTRMTVHQHGRLRTLIYTHWR
jgi:hypothetical protein